MGQTKARLGGCARGRRWRADHARNDPGGKGNHRCWLAGGTARSAAGGPLTPCVTGVGGSQEGTRTRSEKSRGAELGPHPPRHKPALRKEGLPCLSDDLSSTSSVRKLSGELLSTSPAPLGSGGASEFWESFSSSSSWMGDDGDRRVLGAEKRG